MKKFIVGLLFFALLSTLFISISLYTNRYNVDFRESQKIDKLNNDGEYTLDGKTIVMLGDSLIAGYNNEKGGLDKYLEEVFPNTTFKNYAVSGATISKYSLEQNVTILEQAKKTLEIQENKDIVIINGGINDAIGFEAGYLPKNEERRIGHIYNKEGIDSNDVSVASDLEKTFNYIKKNNPNAKIAYLQLAALSPEDYNFIVLENKGDGEKAQKRFDDYNQEIRNACYKWSIYYIDISGPLQLEPEYKSEDRLHLSNLGYTFITAYLKDFLLEVKNF